MADELRDAEKSCLCNERKGWKHHVQFPSSERPSSVRVFNECLSDLVMLGLEPGGGGVGHAPGLNRPLLFAEDCKRTDGVAALRIGESVR